MKNKLLLLLLCSCISTIITAQFYNAFKNATITERETAAIPLGSGFIFGYTKTNNQKNFHENILLIKTNNSGHIVWSNTYDAGTGISLHLIEMIGAGANVILVSCIISGDNNFDSSQRCLLKLSANGTVIWCKKYKGGNPYDCKGFVQLQDSSFVLSIMAGETNPVILHVGGNGNLISTKKITNRQFISVHSITATGNSADIIVGNTNKVNINFKTDVITAQQQYNTSNQFTALLSGRCRNGDLIYLAGRTAGGSLTGASRIFRTTASGNLIWAKNIAAFFNTSGSPFSVFDIVQQMYVHEDINGNIIACVMEESTTELIIVLDSTGKYLYNRVLLAPLGFISETASGDYLNTAPPSTTTSNKIIFASRILSKTSSCDSSVIVKITNGTDSAAALDKLLFASAKFTTTDVQVTVQPVILQQTVFCTGNAAVAGNENDDKEIPVLISPDPASTSIIIRTEYGLPCYIYDINGSLKISGSTNHTIQVNALHPGTYVVAVMIKGEIIRKMFIKE